MESLFQNWKSFFELATFFFKLLVAFGLCMQGGGGICADQPAF